LAAEAEVAEAAAASQSIKLDHLRSFKSNQDFPGMGSRETKNVFLQKRTKNNMFIYQAFFPKLFDQKLRENKVI
jgi:hypothetical protein